MSTAAIDPETAARRRAANARQSWTQAVTEARSPWRSDQARRNAQRRADRWWHRMRQAEVESNGPTVYAEHGSLRTDAPWLSDIWLDLFEEGQERAARAFGNGYRVEATHTGHAACEVGA